MTNSQIHLTILNATAAVATKSAWPSRWNGIAEVRERLVILENDVLPMIVVAIGDREVDTEETFENMVVIDYPVIVGCAFAGNLLVGADLAALLEWRQAMNEALWALPDNPLVSGLVFRGRDSTYGNIINQQASGQAYRFSVLMGSYRIVKPRS